MPTPFRPHAYTSLNDLLKWNTKVDQRLRLAIVTPDLLGPVRNGGIGTACSYLANALACHGHVVHILFSQNGAKAQTDEGWIKKYTDKGINVSTAETWDAERGSVACFPNHPPLYMAHVVHDWLAAQPDFDLVLFMEWQGHGFYAMHAKACGQRFQNTVLAVVVHSPSIWHICNNAEAPDNPIQSCTWHMERSCMEMADALISPSAYMLDWCRDHHFKLPRHVFVQPNLLEWDEQCRHTSDNPIDEVVFFGRLEYRKGLEQFCSALDILAKRAHLPKRVTFMGKCAWMGEEHSVLYIARRSEAWKGCTISLHLHYDQHQAVSYLCGQGRLAVMPSVADNSPYTVYECLMAGVPFLARQVGGVAELIREDDRATVLFSDNPHELAAKLHATVGQPPFRAGLAFDPPDNQRAWCAGLPKLTQLILNEQRTVSLEVCPSSHPFISVCLTHYNRPHFLRQAVDSLLAQNYPHFEVILADDGSTDTDALKLLDNLEPLFLRKGWRILRLENGYPAKARNIAANMAKGQWLLFFDDDNVAMPHMLHQCACAAQKRKTGFITIMFDAFEGKETPTPKVQRERFLPIGNAVAYSTIHNTLADTTSLVYRHAFTRVGGFREDYGLGHEDFEFFLRMVLTGEAVSIIPESLFWYRRAKNKSSVQQDSNVAANRMRSLRPFMELWPAPLGELALMAHDMTHAQGRYASPATASGEVSTPCRGMKCDPQSDAVLAQAAAALARSGHHEISTQILESLEDTSHLTSIQVAKLCARAREAASAGRAPHVRQCLKDLAKLSPEAGDNAACCLTILRCLPHNKKLQNVRAEVVERLKAVGDNRISTHLVISGHRYETGKIDEAIIYFFKALVLAEKQYLDTRKDVAQAVRDGNFLCALQHYALHGAKDNTPWPDKHHFSRILRDQPQLLSNLCVAHMTAYHYTNAHLAEKLLESLQESL